VRVVIAFTVPGEPVALGRARVTTRGGFPRVYTPEKSATAKKAVALCAKVAP
jgi:Holliday junction resolvase RusA-like endonuclease